MVLQFYLLSMCLFSNPSITNISITDKNESVNLNFNLSFEHFAERFLAFIYCYKYLLNTLCRLGVEDPTRKE